MADGEVVNIKDGPQLSLTYVVGHDVNGRGGKQSIPNLMNFGVAGGVPGPVVALGKIVYGNNEGGQYSPVAYDEDPAAFALVMRDFDGNFTVHDPTSASHPASMQWTQAQIAGINAVGPPVSTVDIVYGNNNNGQQATIPFGVAATPFTLCYRDEGGHIQVSPGSASTDAVTVDQLDGRLSGAQRTALNALTPIADPSTASAEDVANAVNAIISALTAS